MKYTFDEKNYDNQITVENSQSLKDVFISSIEKGIAVNLKKDLFHADSLSLKNVLKENYFELPNLLNRMNIYRPVNYFSKVQKWVGYVIEINENSFKAKLKDLSQKGTDEIGEFDIEEVSQEDLELVKLGAGFYWSIGHATKNGQAIKESILRFQRLSKWTSYEFDKIEDRAKYLSDNLNWDL